MTELYSYNLPFHSPFRTGAGNVTHRAGFIIRYKDKYHEALSEASPLPGFSHEKPREVQEAVTAFKDKIDHFFCSSYTLPHLRDFLTHLPNLASLQCSLSYLGIVLMAERKNTTLQNCLALPAPPHRIKINAVLSAESPDMLREEFLKVINQGFRTVKIKAPWPTGALFQALNELKPYLQHTRLRLDANRSWPADELENQFSKLRDLPIEYVEEPSQDPDSSISIAQKNGIEIALDESLASPEILQNVLKNHPETYLIIKPMVMGNIMNLLETISTRRGRFRKVVVTTALESVVGRLMASSVAASIGDPDLAHGLDTGQFLKEDLMEEEGPSNGCLILPKKGCRNLTLGQLNPALLKKIC